MNGINRNKLCVGSPHFLLPSEPKQKRSKILSENHYIIIQLAKKVNRIENKDDEMEGKTANQHVCGGLVVLCALFFSIWSY